jgi:formate hydrogenlyase subunit 3/multisubunit Na+/H+ antiporter MnhD subunit
MELYLFFILGVFVVAPFLPAVSEKTRRNVLVLMIGSMILLAFYNLSGVELNDFSVLTSLEEIGMAPLSFTAHPYARMAVFGFLFVGAIALLYGLQVAEPKEQAVSLIAVASAVGIGFSANFITLFFFWEVLTFATAILIMLKQTPHAMRMGYRFMVFHVAGGLLLFFGILQHYAATGSFLIAKPEAGLIFFALAIGFKAAFLPLHVWVAWGYPTASFPSSVVLAGLTTKVGVYAVARILPPHPAIALMGASMAVFGICCALLQKDMRRLLSFHIISQVGYMVAGAGVAGYYGVDGSMLHVINHMLYKALLFMSAGAVLMATGTENMHDLGHHDEHEKIPPVWKVVPIAALGALVGALAISGVPPFNGYVSKYLLKKAMYGVGPAEYMLMFASVGTVVSFCKFVYFGFIKGRAHMKRDITITMKSAILLAAASCIVLGVYPQLAASILPYQSKLAVYSKDGVLTALKFLGMGVVTFIVLKGVLEKGIKPPVWLSAEYLIYQPLTHFLLRTCCNFSASFDTSINNVYLMTGKVSTGVCRYVGALDSSLNEAYEKSGSIARRLAEGTERFDTSLNEAYEKSGSMARRLADRTQQFDGALNDAYEKSGKIARLLADKTAEFDGALDDAYEQSGSRSRSLWDRLRGRPTDWNIKNLNFDSFLMALMLGLFLFILIYYTRNI